MPRIALRDQVALFNDVADVAPSKSKIIARNTSHHTLADKSEIVILHKTKVAIRNPDSSIVLDSGGWRTVTTKDRMNEALRKFASPCRVDSERGLWYVHNSNSRIGFYDGIKLPKLDLPSSKRAVLSATRALKTQIKTKSLIKRYTDTMLSKNLFPYPDNGDCWFCLLHEVKTGVPMGDLSQGRAGGDHLMSHLKERYIHGSLIVNALRANGIQDQGIRYYLDHAQDGDKWSCKCITRSVRKYFGNRLGLAT